ncbi:MAG TPA: hypothetical protein VGH74_17625 [Planctomycetaceae bacterium]
MPSHRIPETRHVPRFYRAVIIGRGGDRITVSEHDTFLAAEQVAQVFPSEDGAVIRIESVIKSADNPAKERRS